MDIKSIKDRSNVFNEAVNYFESPKFVAFILVAILEVFLFVNKINYLVIEK